MAHERIRKERMQQSLAALIGEAFQIPSARADQVRAVLDASCGDGAVSGAQSALAELSGYCATHDPEAECGVEPVSPAVRAKTTPSQFRPPAKSPTRCASSGGMSSVGWKQPSPPPAPPDRLVSKEARMMRAGGGCRVRLPV
eukprot:TRINITY_DN19152_c0_g1_i1.p1 TRINITY_DN19152_c0_g1~~TRINITY_DN19152_c0_g1_i1.p1  ORF type:complete len:142 (+),score=21.75 TRINITY_DN19152_c0_g1_i1:105-530(+)